MSVISITGVSESRLAPVITEYTSKKDQGIVVCSNLERAKRLALDLSFFIPDKEILLFPSSDNFLFSYDAKNRDDLISRLKALKKLRNHEKVLLICPISSFLHKYPPHESFESKAFILKRGEKSNFEETKERLIKLGYERVTVVETRGEFSLRGGIIDIFTPDSDLPFRIEFFGDEIDSIRTFNLETQLSLENLKEITIYPASELNIEDELFKVAITKIEKEYDKAISKAKDDIKDNLEDSKNAIIELIQEIRNVQFLERYLHYFYDDIEYIYDYMEDGILMFEDPDRILEELKNIIEEEKNSFNYLLSKGEVIKNDEKMLTSLEEFYKAYSYNDIVFYSPFAKAIKGVERLDNLIHIKSRETLKYNGNVNSFIGDIKSYIKKEYEIYIICESKERLNNIKELLLEFDVVGNIKFLEGSISSGIEYPDDKKVWITERDIFNNPKKKRIKVKDKFDDNSMKLRKFTDIKEGDYVVHIHHGIGKFSGICQMNFENEKKDYIKIQYAGTDILYVPVEHLDMVQKYIGSGVKPKINRLSGTDWIRTKERTKKEILTMAQDLIELYAKRSIQQGYQFGKDTVWQSEFEEAFLYTETDDQLRATEEIKRDMEKPIPMDRLLLGDVGFGKTEVAARAAFKCLSEGKQVAFLVPTTILANQHFYTLKDRFEHFPFKVEVLSRFKTKAQQDKIIEDLKAGRVDFVIGTHRLLSNDVKFKDLGLLIIDEEQRFGVEAKENIKKLKNNVDCLTLTATPIPRTLNMSLNGIKDMSLLETPPQDRYPVQTYVLEQDDEIIKDAILRELNRGGQVYIVFNRIVGINNIYKKISELVPEARVAFGHGRMKEDELERIMLDFINHDVDVLISTTIIESGLDIPNANTMIVLDSDRYGLSELYQLRGRVGRTNRMAYCYLMHEPNKVLTEIAEKRLNAIREFTEFGSGFKIAIRDLEIRGAGNLLGEAQSGHMSGVGYELYIKMIDDCVKTLKGERVRDEKKEAHIEIPVSAYIPDKYIDDELIKMDIYKKISSIRSFEDEEDIMDELIDRFGDIPEETINLIKISHIRYMCEEIGIVKAYKVKYQSGGSEIKTKRNKIVFDFDEENKLNAFVIYNLNEILNGNIFIHLGRKPYISLNVYENEMLDKSLEMLGIIMDNIKDNVI